MNLRDTIVAIATPPGRGGLGIVRLSGERALPIANQITRSLEPFQSWSPRRAELLDSEGMAIDDVLVTWFQKPRSYTAEDVVEISCHGAPIVLASCVERATRAGARLAEPGEFTLRAFLNGRLDLSQAEAVGELVAATTLHQARVAAGQAAGSLARQLVPWKEDLLELIALLEAGIDFAEDDISVAPPEELLRRLRPMENRVAQLAASYAYGRVLREGFTLAIVGQPNVGKSSLFNSLLEQDRAIVTDTPGTTRDLVSEATAIDGIPVRLVDTAGIREGEGLAETLGIERSFQAMADADLTLVVTDAAAPRDDRDIDLIARARAQGRFLVVANKSDLGLHGPDSAITVSAKTGQGIEQLRAAIVHAIAPGGAIEVSHPIVTSLRQQQLLAVTLESLQQASIAVAESIPHEMLLLDLYNALYSIDGLTGKTTADDILNRIFSTFCIGK